MAVHASGLDPRTLHPVGLVAQIALGSGVGAVWTVVWFLLQLRQWWLPYLFGPTLLHSDFRWYVEHGYTETLRILPRRSTRPTPDLQHMTLQILSLSAAVLTVRAYVKMRAVSQRTA
jgi:hypothetical protein